MPDILGLLHSTLHQCRGNTLLVADENCLEFSFHNLDHSVSVVSNRIDVAHRAEAAGLWSRFCDFDLQSLPAPVDNLVYRLSKEKPVVHHIVNQAGNVLAPGGCLWLLGGKQEGIKTFAKTVGDCLGSRAEVSKEGLFYRVKIIHNAMSPRVLDDRNYSRLREIHRLNDRPVFSKPGLFGWDSVDKGSQLLAAYLPEFLSARSMDSTTSLLDLGCGYGYLSLEAARRGNFRVTATDNCAAALIACAKNFEVHGIRGEVTGDDCGAAICEKFSIVLCNPPFHQGFQQERKLTEKFLANTRRLLHSRGSALFVVNQFVPLETLAKDYFSTVATPVTREGFKLVVLSI